MKLRNLRLRNYRCFEELDLTDLPDLVVIIGENDAGKTYLLKSISALLGKVSLTKDDLHEPIPGEPCNDAFIEGEFEVEAHDNIDSKYQITEGEKKYLYLRIDINGSKTDLKAKALVYVDNRANTFHSLSAADQKAFLVANGITKPGSNNKIRLRQYEEAISTGAFSQELKYTKVNRQEMATTTPNVESISTEDYRDPTSLLRDTFRSIMKTIVYPPTSEGEESLEEDRRLIEIRSEIEERLRTAAESVITNLKKINPKLLSITIEPNIDFTNAITGVNLQINDGQGDKKIDQFGTGTNKRLFFGLLEWQYEEARTTEQDSYISLYDEPDTNLHVKAQQELYESISRRVIDPQAKTQAFVCTHSLHLINRSKPEAIVLLEFCDEKSRKITRLLEPSETALRDFLTDIGHSIGLTNASLLYEKSFLIAEGESEAEALPILYRRLYNSSLHSDGIVLVNLKTCSAWKSAVELLLVQRTSLIQMLLDTDCLEEGSSAKLTAARIREAGLNDDFLEAQVEFIGSKEFEDAFTDEDWITGLNAELPKHLEGEEEVLWASNEIQELRSHEKFSQSVVNLIKVNVIEESILKLISRKFATL